VRKSELEYYAMLSKTGVHHYSGSECSATMGWGWEQVDGGYAHDGPLFAHLWNAN
jgi:hypothetical protein